MNPIRCPIISLLLSGGLMGLSACEDVTPVASETLLETQTACTSGDYQACELIEESYWAKVRHLNLEAFKKECATAAKENDDAEAICGFADHYNFLKEDRFPSDGHLRLRHAIESACDTGYAEACRKTADIYSHEGGSIDINHIDIFRDDAAALELRMRACDLGDYWSCLKIGHEYYSGRGIGRSRMTPDQVEMYADRRGKIQAFFRDRCDREDGLSCYNLAKTHGHFGHAHLKPFGIEPDLEKALTLLERGCKLESWDACLFAGELYLEGEDVPQDIAVADTYLGRGCELGDPKACARHYFLLHDEGRSEEARESLRRACDMKRSDDVFVRVRASNVQCRFLDRD